MWQPPFGTMQVELREWHKRPDGQGRGVSNEIMQQLIFSVAKIQNFIHLLDESEYWGRGDPTTINLSNRSKTWNTWNIGRPNRANWVMRIRHSVRALGPRFTQKTFGVYPSTFSILEAHRVHWVIISLFLDWNQRFEISVNFQQMASLNCYECAK